MGFSAIEIKYIYKEVSTLKDTAIGERNKTCSPWRDKRPSTLKSTSVQAQLVVFGRTHSTGNDKEGPKRHSDGSKMPFPVVQNLIYPV